MNFGVLILSLLRQTTTKKKAQNKLIWLK